MSCVIRVATENCKRSIELLGQHQPRQGMRHGQGTERKQELGLLAGCFRPAAGRANGEYDVLRAVVTPLAEPGGKDLGSHLAASAIEQHGDCRCSALLAALPFEKSLLGAKCLWPAAGKGRASVEIDLGQRVKSVFRCWPGTDVCQCQLHGEEHILCGGCATVTARTLWALASRRRSSHILNTVRRASRFSYTTNHCEGPLERYK